jgi:hypothetical protein
MKVPQSNVSITQGNTSMDSPDELKAHLRRERDKVCSRKVDFLDELQEYLIKEGGKGTPLWWSH